jgi:hypothetical protein
MTHIILALLENLNVSLTKVGEPNSRLRSTTGDFQQVLYGAYLLEVDAPGFIRFSRQIDVNDERQWISAALQVGSLGGRDTFDLAGEVGPPAHKKDHISIKLVSIFSDLIREAAVRSDGTFKFPDVPGNTYVLFTLRGAEVCDTRTHAVTYRSQKVSIVLSPAGCGGN